MRYSLLAVLVLVFLATVCFGERDVTADIHLHTRDFHKSGAIDGLVGSETIFAKSLCRVVVFTEHLDGVTERGCDLYLRTIRGLSTDKKLAVPGVEVTCGSGYSAYDVLVIGLTSESLNALSAMLKKGAFIDPENGLPCIKNLANRYGFVLIAAHPDNNKIPFNLAEHSGYCDGFELYDSDHAKYTVGKLEQNLADFYIKGADQVILTAGSDYHFALAGALPTKSMLDAPITRVILDDGADVSEQNVVDSFRRGRIYATSIIGARIVSASCIPGLVWDVASQDELLMTCVGFDRNSMLTDEFVVVVSNGQKARRLKYIPVFKDGKAVLAITFGSLEMPDATVCNVNFGGRLVTSTIKISPPKAQPTVVAAGNEVTSANKRTPPVSTDPPVPNIAGTWVGRGDTYEGGKPCRVTIVIRQENQKLEYILRCDGLATNFSFRVVHKGRIDPNGEIHLDSRVGDLQSHGIEVDIATGRDLRLLTDGSIRQVSRNRVSTTLQFVVWRQ